MQEIYDFIISIAGKREHKALPQAQGVILDLFASLDRTFMANGIKLLLNVQTGLADGADMEAAEAFINWRSAENSESVLTGVFPFREDEYIQTITQKKRFKKLCGACNSIVMLDGRYLPGDDLHAKKCRSRAYRQQACYLLQACDILLAITDETATLKAGGTMETVNSALQKGIPVVFFSLQHLCFFHLSTPTDITRLIFEDNSSLKMEPDEIAGMIINSIFRHKTKKN